jgi:hypothetical protein
VSEDWAESDAPWWPVVVETEYGQIEDAIRGHDRDEAIYNATWNWPTALRITVAAEPVAVES